MTGLDSTNIEMKKIIFINSSDFFTSIYISWCLSRPTDDTFSFWTLPSALIKPQVASR